MEPNWTVLSVTSFPIPLGFIFHLIRIQKIGMDFIQFQFQLQYHYSIHGTCPDWLVPKHENIAHANHIVTRIVRRKSVGCLTRLCLVLGRLWCVELVCLVRLVLGCAYFASALGADICFCCVLSAWGTCSRFRILDRWFQKSWIIFVGVSFNSSPRDGVELH